MIHSHKDRSLAYFNSDCDACTAHPPVVPEVVHVWLVRVEKYTWEAPGRVPKVLSMINPLVPPAAASAALGSTPAFSHVTVPSAVRAPAVVPQVGAVPFDVPATATISTLPLLSTMRARKAYAWVAAQSASAVTVLAPWFIKVTVPFTVVVPTWAGHVGAVA